MSGKLKGSAASKQGIKTAQWAESRSGRQTSHWRARNSAPFAPGRSRGGTGSALERAEQQHAGLVPVALHGAQRQGAQRGDLDEAHAGEEMQFHHFGEARIRRGQV